MKKTLTKFMLIFVLAFFVFNHQSHYVYAIELDETTLKTIHKLDDDSERTIEVRMNGHIPYTKLSDVYKMLISPNIRIARSSQGIYEITSERGTATIDTSQDILSTVNYPNFISTPEPEDDVIPIIIKDFKETISGEKKATTIDFKRYNIDLIGAENDIWVPFQTAVDMFLGAGFYDGTELYILGDYSLSDLTDHTIYKSLHDFYFENDARFSDFANYFYNELCFTFDYLYGAPSKSILSSSIRANGLDYTLEHYDNDTKQIKSWLLSESLEEFFYGFSLLGSYLYDGGHTSVETPLMTYVGFFRAMELLENMKNYDRYNKVTANELAEFSKNSALVQAKNVALDPENYYEQGDTAFCAFDSFYYDELGWRDYYKGNSSSYPNDTLGVVLTALDRASSNPNISYFVFDISRNDGGLGFVAPVIMAHLGYDTGLAYKNSINNQVDDTHFMVDTNHDGIYNNNDKTSKYSFKYGVLTSSLTFSTANFFSSLARDNGFLILGEKSGGGACTVKTRQTAEGVAYAYSSVDCLINKAGNFIDEGIEVDNNLVIKDGAAVDYSQFFDLGKLSEYLHAFYDNNQPSDDIDPNSGYVDNEINEYKNIAQYTQEEVNTDAKLNDEKDISTIKKTEKTDAEFNDKKDLSTTKKTAKETDVKGDDKANEKKIETSLPVLVILPAAGVLVVVFIVYYKYKH